MNETLFHVNYFVAVMLLQKRLMCALFSRQTDSIDYVMTSRAKLQFPLPNEASHFLIYLILIENAPPNVAMGLVHLTVRFSSLQLHYAFT